MLRTILTTLLMIFVGSISLAQEYALQPGDTLGIEVLEDPTLNRTVLVLPDGNINFPFAGAIRAKGRSLGQVQAQLATSLAPNFATKPTVFVSLSGLNPTTAQEALNSNDLIDIYFLGEVNTPGLVQVPKGTTLLQALAVGGGLTNFAATKRIQLRRSDTKGREVVYKFDYKAISRGAQITGATVVSDGDVILVPQRRLFE